MEKGLSVDAIAKPFFGHDYFQLVDPDGNGITVYTSHRRVLAAEQKVWVGDSIWGQFYGPNFGGDLCKRVIGAN